VRVKGKVLMGVVVYFAEKAGVAGQLASSLRSSQ
jgi:hypothetical protein